MTAATPFVFLPLDERFGDSLHDLAGKRRNARVAGDVEIVDDEIRGPCLELGGGTLSLPALDPADFPAGLTLVCWIKHAADGNLARFGDSGARLGLAATAPESGAGEVVAVFTGVDAPGFEHRLASANEWSLFALAVDTDLLAVRSPSPQQYPTDEPAPPPWRLLFGPVDPTVPQTIVLGGSDLRGRISALRIYTGALSTDDLDELRRADVIAARALGGALPISLSLEGEDASPVLFIDARDEGHTMTLRVDNDSRAPVHLALPAAESADDWHFQLSLRPGTLTRLDNIRVTTPGWTLTTIPGSDESGVLEDRLRLRAADGPRLPVTVELAGLVADARQGTRTTRVELAYQNLRSAAAGAALAGERTQQLALINHLGRRQLPLRVGLVGSNRVVLGRTADLRLHIANTMPDAGTSTLRFDAHARVLLSFDEGHRDDCPWTLADRERIKQIRVHFGHTSATRESPEIAPDAADEARSARWILPLEGLELAPHEHLEVLLLDVPADGLAGPSNLHVDLVDIPDYWNNSFTCAIDKVEPPRTWQPLPLRDEWLPDPDAPPEVYRDPADVVHLRGACWRPGWPIYTPDSGTVLDLPSDARPGRPLQLPGHASVWQRPEGTLLAHPTCSVDVALAVAPFATSLPWESSFIALMPADVCADPSRWAILIRLDGLTWPAAPADARPATDPPVTPPEDPPPQDNPITTPRRLGPAGPADGDWFDDTDLALARPISRLIVRSGEVVDGLQVFHAADELPHHGGHGGYPTDITLEPGDVLTEISGYTGQWFGREYLLQLVLRTRDGREYGPFGTMSESDSAAPFSFTGEPGEQLVAFHGATTPGQQADGSMSVFLTGLGVVFATEVQP